MELLHSIFAFIGGLGFFLLGMNLMSDGLQKRAGEKMRKLMNMLTSNRLLGVFVGTLVTVVIQSSSATTVMVIGFVNSGLMTLVQSVGVIMGANIGTTVTAWLVSLNEFSKVLKPEFIAPLLVGIGVVLKCFSSSNRRKDLGEIILGFGALFVGLSFMGSSIKPYAQSPLFSQAFQVLGSNPLLGLLVGTGVTAIIQSSSASLGILQTLAMSGSVTTSSAIYIALGQNIGTCVTALLSSSGASRMAKRAAVIHLMFNVVGALLCLILVFPVFMLRKDWAHHSITAVEISIFHSLFNIINTAILFPCAKLLVALSYRLIPHNEDEQMELDDVSVTSHRLDRRLLVRPNIALETAEQEMQRFGRIVQKNLQTAYKAFESLDLKYINRCIKKEKQINRMNAIITEFVVELSKMNLSEEDRVQVDHILYTLANVERVGDHAENLAEIVADMIDKQFHFQQEATEEVKKFFAKSTQTYDLSLQAREKRSKQLIQQAYATEDKVDELEKIYRANHIARLSSGDCSAVSGIYFFEILSNLERISDHATNIAEYTELELNEFI